METKRENPDLVENISTADVDVLGHQRADGAIVVRHAREKPPQHSDEYAKEHAQREREIEKKSVYGRCHMTKLW